MQCLQRFYLGKHTGRNKSFVLCKKVAAKGGAAWKCMHTF